MCHGVTRGDEFQFCEPVTRYRVVFPNSTHQDRDKIAAIFKCIFLYKIYELCLGFHLGPKARIDIIPALFWIMACWRPGDKLLSEPMMVSLLTRIRVTRYQWVNTLCVVCGIHASVNLGHNCLRQWPVSGSVPSPTWTNIYLLSIGPSGIYLSEIQSRLYLKKRIWNCHQ